MPDNLSYTVFGEAMNSYFDPTWTTIPEICNLTFLLTVVPVPANPDLVILARDNTIPMQVTV